MITCDRKLRNCVHFTYHNVAFAAGITHFTFSLPTLRGLSISLLHDFISSAINLELLSLKAGHVTSTQATRLLRDTNFASLEIFQCNFPHSGLVQFLKRHPRIETIDLGRCRAASGSCPIATKGDTLPTLHSVSGPLSCLSQLIPGRPIETASAQYTCAHDVPSLLSSFLFTTSVIRVLHVDVLPHDVSLLRRISIATPLVSSLKLNELSFKKVSYLFPPHLRSQFYPLDPSSIIHRFCHHMVARVEIGMMTSMLWRS